MSCTAPQPAPPGPAAGVVPTAEDQLLLDRIRLGLQLILAGIAIVFVGELLVNPGDRPLISVVQAINFAAVTVALLALRQASRRTFNYVVGFAAYAVTVVAIGAIGIVASDAMTPVVMFVGLSVVTATLVPWSPRWQFASVVLVTLTAIWTVSSVVPSPRLFWLQHVGSVAPTLLSTVFLSHVLRRQRHALAAAERERQSREASLREANRRLEREILEHRKTEDALRFAMRELDHRVKNTLATVQSVAEQTIRSSPTLAAFGEAFGGRIQALARIHTALAARKWDGLPLGELVELVVGPYRHHADSITVECEPTFIGAELARVIGMSLHELATNAAKHGALSTADGHVAVTSRVGNDGQGTELHIDWTERHGPAVGEPARRGFGLRLIEEALAYEAGGHTQVRFTPAGLQCRMDIPMERPSA